MGFFKCGCLINIFFVLYLSNIESLNICQIRDGCQELNANQTFYDRNCFCDDECLQFGDCCEDATIILNIGDVYEKGRTKTKCVTQIINKAEKGYKMIGNCPKDWSDKIIKDECEILNQNSNFFTALPVTNIVTGQTYKNMYCYSCNNVKGGFLIHWNLNVTCEPSFKVNDTGDVTVKYDSKSKTWEMISYTERKPEISPCTSSVELPEIEIPIRQCHSKLISKCPESWINRNIHRLCQVQTAFRFRKDEAYRNKYCAKCNGVSEENITCQPSEMYKNKNSRPHAQPLSSFRSLLSYSMMFNGITNDPTKFAACPKGQIRDSYNNCREFECSRNAVLKNGICEDF